MNRRRFVLLLLVVLGLGGLHWFARPGRKPVASPPQTPGAEQAHHLFSEKVVPILDRQCGTCHGLVEARHRAGAEPPTRFFWRVDEGGRIATARQTAFAQRQCLELLEPGTPPLAELLIRAPLAESHSGHGRHPEIFHSPGDPDCQTLLRWVKQAKEKNGVEPVPLSEAGRFFAEKVTPILVRKTCLGGNCHGQLAFNDLKLDAGVPALPGRFTSRIHEANRRAMLGAKTRLVQLSGDVEQSKQLLKNIPVSSGGILHKGGNRFFEKGDPDYETLRRWLELEVREARQDTGQPLGQVRGYLFVRRPRDTPERFFEDTAFLPGADLFWLRDGEEHNLTRHLHPDGPADIRAPDVRYDGKRVVFTMRRHSNEPFSVWELNLDSGKARQLTFSERRDIHCLDPLYVPAAADPDGNRLDRSDLVFVSNLAGGTCRVSPEQVLGEAEGGSRTVILDDQRTERAGTFDGHRLRVVRGANKGAVRTVTRQTIGRIDVAPPFDVPADETTHYTIEVTARQAARYDVYRMPIPPIGGERNAFPEDLHRLTFSPEAIRRPTRRSSGEIVMTALRTGHQAGRPFYNGALYRIHADGSDFHPHYGNRSGIPILADDRELPNGLEVRIGRSANSYWGGMPILSDHQFGPTIEQNNPLDDLEHPYSHGKRLPKSSQHIFFPGWISLDPAATFGGISPGGAWRDPYPLPDGSILISHAAGPIDLADPNAAPDFDILRLVPDPAFQTATGIRHGRYRRERVLGNPEWSELWARPVWVRRKEPVRLSKKWDEELFGPPPEAGGLPAYPETTPALLQIYDVPLLDTFFRQTTPTGHRHLATATCPNCARPTPEDEQIRYLRLVGLRPSEGGRRPAPFIIDEIPLEADGSVQAILSSGIGFDIQSLNADRMALRSPNRWLYCVPGEKHTLSIPRTLYPQTCAGCHGGLTGRPVDTLRRPDGVTSASQTLATWNAATHKRRLPPVPPAEDLPGLGGVNFDTDLRPILRRRCVSCHDAAQPAADLSLVGSGAFSALRGQVDHTNGRAIRSYLMEKLMGRELQAPRPLEGDKPHPSNDPITREERLLFIRWIDLGAQPPGGEFR